MVRKGHGSLRFPIDEPSGDMWKFGTLQLPLTDESRRAPARAPPTTPGPLGPMRPDIAFRASERRKYSGSVPEFTERAVRGFFRSDRANWNGGRSRRSGRGGVPVRWRHRADQGSKHRADRECDCGCVRQRLEALDELRPVERAADGRITRAAGLPALHGGRPGGTRGARDAAGLRDERRSSRTHGPRRGEQRLARDLDRMEECARPGSGRRLDRRVRAPAGSPWT